MRSAYSEGGAGIPQSLRPTTAVVPGAGYVEVRTSSSSAYTGTWYGHVIRLIEKSPNSTQAQLYLGNNSADSTYATRAFNACI
ncbi:hypothetical protein [Ruegeria atlantica]|uniref:hypothetical protein n=1 Tax=Ruegeria atlantica TaxID=81569 RepID=UPI001F3C980E|nr:hypothetical protein [Ruegeria atlantica]